MKKLLFVLFVLATTNSFAQSETISGNGTLKRESREVGSFTAVSVLGNVNVELAYGNSKSISIEGDENLLPFIETKIENDNLVVKIKDRVGVRSKNKLLVYVTASRITKLKVSGSGNIKGNGDFSNDGKTEISVTGSGNINVAMNSFSEMKINISGSGNVTLKGKGTNNINAAVSGSGNIDCSDVICNDVFAHLSGSGNIKVFANRSIDARVSGSGNIYYKGAATNINVKSVGSGKIIKA